MVDGSQSSLLLPVATDITEGGHGEDELSAGGVVPEGGRIGLWC